MSKFIKVKDRLINTDTIAEITEWEVTLKDGSVIPDVDYYSFSSIENDGQFIPANVITYAVQPCRYCEDGAETIVLEEYPIIGWRVARSLDTSASAVPVFHAYAGDFMDGSDGFYRFHIQGAHAFRLAIRFEGSDTIWHDGFGFNRESFIKLCEARVAEAKASEDQKKQQQEK